MKLAAQIIIACLFVTAFFRGLHQDFYGVKARAPHGYSGAVVSVLLLPVGVGLYYYAGAFSLLLGSP